MSRRILFLDRDGCLIEEPADFQIDRFDKFNLMPGVIAALQRCVRAGFELVMVSNQDGLGTPSFAEADFRGPHELLLRLLASQGIEFREVLIDRSFASEGLDTRKPGIGLVRHWLAADDWSRADSAMVGDRDTDLAFAANLGVRGLRVGANGMAWDEIARQLCEAPRQAVEQRRTQETDVHVAVDLDCAGNVSIASGLAFFDHMLEQVARHAGIGLRLECRGDTHVDEHHTVEDCGLALGTALRRALGAKRGIARYGFTLPMDESLASAALDLGGRPLFVFEGQFPRERVGDLPTELVPHFFRSLCETLGANLHLSVTGENCHHMVEACFKVFARCLGQAVRIEGTQLPSTKGVL